MPLDFDEEVKERAKALFEQDMKSPTKILKTLKREFKGRHDVPTLRTIHRWRDAWEKGKVIQEGIATLVKDETPTHAASESPTEESGSVAQRDISLHTPVSLRDKELPKPPLLTELIGKLIESGVPKKSAQDIAPGLLADWEIAFREDDYLQARTCERAVAILKEVPGIPYKKALALGHFEAKLEWCEIDSLKDSQYVFDLIDIYKRYRPWDGKENQKAYQKMVNWWFEKTEPLREKIHADAERAIANIFSTASQKEEK